jgi:hypothetical protein
MTRFATFLGLVLWSCAGKQAVKLDSVQNQHLGPIDQIKQDAKNLAPLVQSPEAIGFLQASQKLTAPAFRELMVDPVSGKFLSRSRFDSKKPASAEKYQPASPEEVTEIFYNTAYGSPLAYVRALDVASKQGLRLTPQNKVADFGFGNIGQLRMFAQMGLLATGIDDSDMLKDLYSNADDVGPYGNGSVQLAFGKFPQDDAIVQRVGTGLQLFISKNTLKRGYIHPEREPGKPEWLIHLGVSDEVFLRAIHDSLESGGYFVIYNICPKPTPLDKPFQPWTDGRSPFSEEQLKAAGFDVKQFNIDDTIFVREMAKVLHWQEQGMDLDDLSVLYTIAQRKE